MANSKSAEKRARQALRRRLRNRSHMSTMRTAIKRLRQVVEEGDRQQASELLPKTISIVASTAQKGVIHRNAAARTASRLTHAVQTME